MLVGRLERQRRAGVDAGRHARRRRRHSEIVAHDVGVILVRHDGFENGGEGTYHVNLGNDEAPIPGGSTLDLAGYAW
jgi:hypothetical protein